MDAALDPSALAGNALAVEVLRTCGEVRIRVVGSSMLPAIRAGDILSVRHCAPADANVGDIVLFSRYGRLFAHRVIAHRAGALVTQGDGVSHADPPVVAAEFVGRVSSIERHGRTFSVATNSSLAARAVGAFLRRFAACIRGLRRLTCTVIRAGP